MDGNIQFFKMVLGNIMKTETKEKYKVIRAEEGYVLTNYKEGDNILNYSSFKECICPLSCDLKHLNEITIEKDQEYLEAQEKAEKEEELNTLQ